MVFAPVAIIETTRLEIATTTFGGGSLNGTREEEVYVSNSWS